MPVELHWTCKIREKGVFKCDISVQLALSPKRSIQPEISVNPVVNIHRFPWYKPCFEVILIKSEKKWFIYTHFWQCCRFLLEGVLILRNSSLKLKTVADNAILLNRFTSSENISECMKIKTEFGFHLKVNVCIFRRNGNCPKKIIAPSTFC